MTKSFAHGLLALAVSTSIALASGGGEGDKKNENAYQGDGLTWKPGSGISIANSDEFSLRWSNQLQVQYQLFAFENAPDTSNFTVRRARTTFKGNVFNRNIRYMLQVDGVDAGASLKEGWVSYDFIHEDDSVVGVRAGQSKTGFGLESAGGSSALWFVERSVASNVFADAYTRGAWLYGSYMQNKLRWFAGAQNGDVSKGIAVIDAGEEGANASDNELSYNFNVSFDPLGSFVGDKPTDMNFDLKQGDLDEGTPELRGTIGAGIFFGNSQPLVSTGLGAVDVESTCINLNTAWRVKNFYAMGEVFIRSDDPDVGTSEDSLGWYAQAGYALPKADANAMQWGLGLRVSMIDTDDTAALLGGTAGKQTDVSVVADAFYHGHACKTQFEYTLQDVDIDGGGAADSTNHLFRIQFQLLF